MEIIGYIGGAFLTISGVPEVIRTMKDKKAYIGWNMLVLWFIGEIFMVIYSIDAKIMPLIINYVFNFFVVIVMLAYKIRYLYRRKMNLTLEHIIP